MPRPLVAFALAFTLALVALALSADRASARVPLDLAAALPAGVSATGIEIAREKPIRATERDKYTQDVTTAAVHLLQNDLTVAQRAEEFLSQNIIVDNRHAANSLCVDAFLFATSCASTCSGSGLTCGAARPNATDGTVVGPGSWKEIPIMQDQCLCGIATAAATTVTAYRTTRGPG